MSRLLLAGPAVILAAVAWSASPQDPKEPVVKAVPRKPWTTSKVVGSPDPPPPFKAARVFPEVKFHHPLLIARCPGTDRLFVGEQEGVLYSVANKPDAKKDVFFDLRKELKTLGKTKGAAGIGELYGLVFHPNFEQNRYCYVCYTLARDPSVPKLPDGTRVSRFTVTKTDPPRIDPDSEEIVITFQGGGHNGGDLHFGPKDGMLYISTGDGSGPNPPDLLNTGQDCSDLLSSVLRIDVDHKGEPGGKGEPSGKGEPGGVSPRRNYSVPKDNPFVGMKDVRPEIWAFGFRNPWRMSFDRQTADLWVGDVGWELWEMVHKIEKGGNYGWSIVEGRQPVKTEQKPGPTPILPPTIELSHTISMSVTGGYVYRGKKFPELAGAYIFGDWETRRMWAARFEGDRLKEMPEIIKPALRIVAFGEDHAGELYFLDYDGGMMYTLDRSDPGAKNTNFPTKLSDTGLFASVKEQKPAEGVIPFSPNARQWQDGANAEWWLALPGTSSVTLYDKARPLPQFVDWHSFRTHFPKEAVLVKTISMEVMAGGKPSQRRLETQLLHFDGQDWYGYTFAWRDDQTDADLVPADGAEKVFEVPADYLPAGKREQVWTFHSRAQCISCHSSWSDFALAFSPGQLNGPGQVKDGPNQLVRFSQEGYIRRATADDNPLPPFDEKSAAKEVVVVDPHDSTKPIDQRARSYMQANCAHCHKFGGGGSVSLELDITKPLKETGLIDARPKQGDFGLPDARLVAAGDPCRSILYYRMAKFGRGRMPHMGSEWPDPTGLRLMHDWIFSLGNPAAPPLKEPRQPDLGTTRGGLMAVRHLGPGAGPNPFFDRAGLVAAAGKLPPGPVRDLFEGYLPPDPKGRKIGSNPRPAALLALPGDAKRGEVLFFTESLQCAKCHKVGDKGVSLGPDLTAIGKTRTKAELLESLLQPSVKVEPKYAAYLVKTADGRSFTGLLVKRDDKQVILRDAENKEITLDAANVETVQPSRLSLMPEGLVSGLTAPEAADLLEFLASRK